MERFIVICRADCRDDGAPGAYTLATRRLFTERDDAEKYAATISSSREPLVVSGRFKELRFG